MTKEEISKFVHVNTDAGTIVRMPVKESEHNLDGDLYVITDDKAYFIDGIWIKEAINIKSKRSTFVVLHNTYNGNTAEIVDISCLNK